jgi:hypothetical protein
MYYGQRIKAHYLIILLLNMDIGYNAVIMLYLLTLMDFYVLINHG